MSQGDCFCERTIPIAVATSGTTASSPAAGSDGSPPPRDREKELVRAVPALDGLAEIAVYESSNVPGTKLAIEQTSDLSELHP